MKIKKEYRTGIIILAVLVVGIAAIYTYKKASTRNDLASRIEALMPRGGVPLDNDDLRKAIGLYEEKIEAHVKDADRTATYWQILATRLTDKGMYTLALEALEQALYYRPEDALLYYLTGMSAAVVAKSSLDIAGKDAGRERDRLFQLSEKSYLRAISLDERYMRPRYGLAILYVFEFNRPAEAIVHLEKILEISKSDPDAMAVLARAYYMTEQYDKALELYDRIISTTKDAQRKRDAENTKALLLKELYG
ncbi:tetratricopeptide repeat protein [Breznakiellaceae bacterium SP9]